MAQKLYSNKAVDDITEQYLAMGGEIEVFREGCLASYGVAVLYCAGYKTLLFQEKYINEWSSATTVRKFRYHEAAIAEAEKMSK